MHFTHSALLPLFVPLLLSSGYAAPYPMNASAPDSIPALGSVSYSGSGCPSSGPGVDRTGVPFSNPHFRLNGYSASSDEVYTSSVNCQVHLTSTNDVDGWQIGVSAVDFKGHVALDPGASFSWYFTSFFSHDAASTSTVRGTVSNPGTTRLNKDVSGEATIPSSDIVWSPCGTVGLLNVNFRVAVHTADNQYAYFGKDADTGVVESWKYSWRRC
jgi:hypothetical protein